ncbi:MAG: undecaprenyl-phosphate glucose phosphotransferase [Prevotella sp.]
MNADSNYTGRKFSFLITCVLIGDIAILGVLFTLLSAYFDYRSDTIPAHQIMIVCAICYLLCTSHNGVLLFRRIVSNYRIAERVIRNIIFYAILSSVMLYLGRFPMPSLPFQLTLWALMALFILIYRLTLRSLVTMYRSNHHNVRNVVFVGSYNNAVAMYNEMVNRSFNGYNVIGYFDDQPTTNFPPECKYLGNVSGVVDYLKSNGTVHEVFCCLPSARKNDILPIINHCVGHLVHFYSMPNISNYFKHRMHLNMFGNVPYLSMYREPLMCTDNRLVKRMFDVFFSLLFLCTLFPFLFLLVAIVTKITMPGPIFFKQKRSGLNGKEFYCIKFRSMKVNDTADSVQATKDDPRKTRWGNIMRKTNIDEFPQFINVLLGQMSIVGPRPHMVKQTNDYSRLISDYMVRHYVKPGITGWSQVTGYRGETKRLSQMKGRVDHDIWYIEHWSLALDIYIIYKTVANIFIGDKNAY